ncbi:MAG: hypothetical protein PHE25_04765 [Candidatus Gracilibacteria bacterium]|nr:hypothetical protein [Candidatus Gracilibacteria bacterium]
MQLNNIKSLLLKSLNKTGKADQILSSIIYKSIIGDFLEIKKIDITVYVISVKMRGNVILIKTNKPILNTELLSIENILVKNISSKLNNIGIIIKDIKLRFK